MVCLQFVLCIAVVIFQITTADKCKTPNNEEGDCVSVYSCPVLLGVLSDPTVREFVRQSNCGGTPVDPLICCGTKSNFTADNIVPPSIPKSLLASKGICGYQHSDDYFHTVNGTVVTEFPWLALIEYKREGQGEKRGFFCTGSLINQRYVLTAAQCLTHEKYKAIGVRLGEFHIKNDTDCIEDSQVVECSDSVQDYGIEKMIIHPQYVRRGNNSYDIALIKMNRTVRYSDYIRPICLSVPGTKQAGVGDLLIASGWGKLKSDNVSEEKKRTYSKIVTHEECKERYSRENFTLKLGDDQLCGLLTSESEIICTGDGGGPVMYSHKSQWYQIGIVSFGSKRCLADYPEVYTNVSYYLGWIEENLEPNKVNL